MKILDFHGHFFPDEVAEHAVETVESISGGKIIPVLDGTMNGLLAGMSEAGVTTTVTLPVATKPEHVESINSILPQMSDKIVPFGALSPFAENWEDHIDCLVEQKIKGVKLHPEYQGFYIDDPKYFPIYQKLADSNIMALFHTGYDPGPFSRDHATPKMVRTVLDAIPNFTIIAGHFGGLLMWDEVEQYLVGQNIYFDTAAIATLIDPKQFVRIVNNHGSEKVLFGSDTPWEGQKVSIDFILSSDLTDQQKENILWNSGTELLNRG